MADQTPPPLPADFLTGSSPASASASKVDLSGVSQHYKNAYAVVLENVFTPEECEQLVHLAEQSTGVAWDQAMIHVGGGEHKVYEDVRKSERMIWDQQEVVDRVWARCAPLVPGLKELHNLPLMMGMRAKDTWEMTRLNDRMRILRYRPGCYFRRELDFLNIVETSFSHCLYHIYSAL